MPAAQPVGLKRKVEKAVATVLEEIYDLIPEASSEWLSIYPGHNLGEKKLPAVIVSALRTREPEELAGLNSGVRVVLVGIGVMYPEDPLEEDQETSQSNVARITDLDAITNAIEDLMEKDPAATIAKLIDPAQNGGVNLLHIYDIEKGDDETAFADHTIEPSAVYEIHAQELAAS
jgi:hypothetical protein